MHHEAQGSLKTYAVLRALESTTSPAEVPGYGDTLHLVLVEDEPEHASVNASRHA